MVLQSYILFNVILESSDGSCISFSKVTFKDMAVKLLLVEKILID